MLRPGGRIAFYTIVVAPGLPVASRRRAAKAGPPQVSSPRDMGSLLGSAGFVGIEERDVTGEFRRVAQARRDANERHADGMRALQGEAEFAERQAERREQLKAIDAGLLRRCLLIAERSQARYSAGAFAG